MPDTYRVNLTMKAATDLEEIFEYIEKDSPQNATRLIRRLLNAIEGLQILPHRHRPVKGAAVLGEQVRSMVVHPYLVRYNTDDRREVVTILSVRHGGRREGS
jgi:toxin ParE1/3/4